MENWVFSGFVVLALAVVLISDAAVVKTDTPENKIEVNDQQASVDTKTPTETLDEAEITVGDFIDFGEFNTENLQTPIQTVEEAPLDATDFLIWKYHNPNCQRPSLLRLKTDSGAAQRVLTCYKSKGFRLEQVQCQGSCFWMSSQGYVKQGCLSTFHNNGIVRTVGRTVKYCNSDLCNA